MKRPKTSKNSKKYLIFLIVLAIIGLWLLNLKLLPLLEKYLVQYDYKAPTYTEKDFIPTQTEANHFKVYYLYKLCIDYKKIPSEQQPKDEEEIKWRSIGYTLTNKFDDCKAFSTFPTVKKYPHEANQAMFAAIYDFPDTNEKYEIQAFNDVLGKYNLRFLVPYKDRDFCFAKGESMEYKEYRLYNEDIEYATDYEKNKFLKNNALCK